VTDSPTFIGQRAHQQRTQWITADGVKNVWFLEHLPLVPGGELVFVGGALKQPDDPAGIHDYKIIGTSITFALVPGAGVKIAIHTGGK
jgi:hypothetical protein